MIKHLFLLLATLFITACMERGYTLAPAKMPTLGSRQSSASLIVKAHKSKSKHLLCKHPKKQTQTDSAKQTAQSHCSTPENRKIPVVHPGKPHSSTCTKTTKKETASETTHFFSFDTQMKKNISGLLVILVGLLTFL